jgi:hypothetical protein
MLDLRMLSDEELVKHCIGLDALTPLELELMHRLEATLDTEETLAELEEKLAELGVE